MIPLYSIVCVLLLWRNPKSLVLLLLLLLPLFRFDVNFEEKNNNSNSHTEKQKKNSIHPYVDVMCAGENDKKAANELLAYCPKFNKAPKNKT